MVSINTRFLSIIESNKVISRAFMFLRIVVIREIPFAYNTKSCCCVTEQNDENPRGWGKGVCNTPRHTVTGYKDIV